MFQRSELAPVEECSAEATPAPPAPITIKDEPIDEGYNAALLPQSSVRQIKEELEQQDVRVYVCVCVIFNLICISISVN